MSTKVQKECIELLQGTLDLLILRTLLLGPAHGHAIGKGIAFLGDEVLQVEQGSLYRLTAKGRRQLQVEISKWDKLAGAIARVLRTSEPGSVS
jgi:DNA-binding PadR family transcriptional regulator